MVGLSGKLSCSLVAVFCSPKALWNYKYLSPEICDSQCALEETQGLVQFFQQTCSKRVFSPYKGEPLVVPDPQFDFPALVKQWVQEEDQLAELDTYDPFDSQSPLSTPPLTLPSTPPTSPMHEQELGNTIPALDLGPSSDSAPSHSKR
ncbi:uncharacterized protein ARMOST_11663 [Armillaria ostoyae]|uniref:Uncharacterized protein n=1 Tax=Armillaria ostoyae TaxID=47428 RepID=A0A284RHS4_ARMOS|nr:uncharacterized protein ARMOST_11663 [Armillaria ostoyae]